MKEASGYKNDHSTSKVIFLKNDILKERKKNMSFIEMDEKKRKNEREKKK